MKLIIDICASRSAVRFEAKTGASYARLSKERESYNEMKEKVCAIFLGVALLLTGCATPVTPPTQALVTGSPPTLTAISTPSTPTAQADPFQGQRLSMVKETIAARGIVNSDVLRAMSSVPRHLFVPQEYLDQAYEDHPLPLGYGQTISQPYIVAWMTELIDLKPGEKVLEIGTGSGYQAAVLAELGDIDVYSIEIVPELAESAVERLSHLGYAGLHLSQGDGYYGWPENAPFDAILVTAAPDHMPAPLADQLAEGGRMVIPIGPTGGIQTLWKFVKEKGELKAYNLGLVAFVPLISEGANPAPDVTRP